MATRFYLPSTGSPFISPAVGSDWEATSSGFVRRRMDTDRANSALASLTAPVVQTGAVRDTVVAQHVSSVLAAGAISGTVKAQIRVSETAGTNDFEPQLVIRVIKPDGTVRGTLLGQDTNTTADTHEFATSLTNRQFPRGGSATLSSVTAVAGDFLVVEFGVRCISTGSATINSTFRFGDPTGGTDLAEDETTTTDDVPWIEFSQTLTFQAGGHVSQEAVEVLNAGSGKARVSQEPVEVLNAGSGKARVSRQAVEVLRRAGVTTAAVSQLAVEVLLKRPPPRVSQLAVEVLSPAAPTRGARLSQTAVEVLRRSTTFGSGPGNGGETFRLKLAPIGTSVTATLAESLSITGAQLKLLGFSGLPTSGNFALTIDDEVLVVTPTGSGTFWILHRGVSNTAQAAHSAGAAATWTDTYDMAIQATVAAGKNFFWASETATLYGWVNVFDCSQAYLGGSRYATHVAELLGVFQNEQTVNKTDGAQPNAVCVPYGTTEDCPSGLGTPARLIDDIHVGDVALARYVNPEAQILELGSRSAALQTWYGFKRVSNTDVDVTTTDPAGHIIDGTIEDEFFNQPFATVTLPGSSRTFTHGGSPSPPNYNEKGWPIAALALRQGARPVPPWTSPDWHDFAYVYSGFGEDCTFVQVLVNRNGLVFGPEAQVQLPGPQDIVGPNVTWGDSSYRNSTSWYVAIFAGPYLLIGPVLNPPGGVSSPPPSSPPVGVVGPGTTSPPFTPAGPTLEGGHGGGIVPPNASASGGVHVTGSTVRGTSFAS